MSNHTSLELSNKFAWRTFEVPHWSKTQDGDKSGEFLSQQMTIRHLWQGGTGAIKTWPAAEIMLDYLVRRKGLRSTSDKLVDASDGNAAVSGTQNSDYVAATTLDLTCKVPDSSDNDDSDIEPPCYNILELGAGAGCLGVGLTTALNREASRNRPFQPKVKIMCTDNDKATIKNLRHNVARQPNERNIGKAMRVETLAWGEEAGGDALSNAVRSQFSRRGEAKRLKLDHEHTVGVSTSSDDSVAREQTKSRDEEDEDPLRLLTHLIASDVLYGVGALAPLSSIVASIKLRNPHIAVIILTRERSLNAVADLKSCIEDKVRLGLETKQKDEGRKQTVATKEEEALLGEFSVLVRDVINVHEVENLKMVEC